MSRKIPPLNPLRAFEVSARHMSFTKAGEELFVTPSAVSHQVKSLEENLGIALFVRDSKTLTLTPAGKAYLPGLQEAFRQLEVATYQLHRGKSASLLKINLPPTFAVEVSGIGLNLEVQPVWSYPAAERGAVVCGAALASDSSPAARTWRTIVDRLGA